MADNLGDFAPALANQVQQQTVSVSSSVSFTGGLATGDIVWSAAATRTNAVICDGSSYDGTTSTYAALWAAIGTSFGGSGQASFKVPDLRDRVPVGAGGNTTLATTEGVAAANRHATRHKHTVTDPGHVHTARGSTSPGSGEPYSMFPYDGNFSTDATAASVNSATTGISVGASSSDPADGPAFAALNAFIIL